MQMFKPVPGDVDHELKWVLQLTLALLTYNYCDKIQWIQLGPSS